MPNQTEASAREIRIHAHHPAAAGRLALRTSLDWDATIEPVAVDVAAGRYEFELTTDEPFLYFKPILLVDGAEPRWACGPDHLATSGAQRIRDVFPSFDDSSAHVTELEYAESASGPWGFRVFLPAGYAENTLHRYPVLYMNDGHNLFFRQEAAAGRDWGVQNTLERLVAMTCIEQVLVVGVYPRDRLVDYTDHGGSNYRRFLVDVLKPTIDARYRTLSDGRHTAIMGSSLGGVAAFETAWAHPEHFGMVGCLSSSFGYADELKTRILREAKPDLRVYLDSGWPRDNFEVTRDLRARLVRAGFVEGVDLLYFAFPGDRHSEVDWGDRCHVPFQFFFGHKPDVRSPAGEHRDPS